MKKLILSIALCCAATNFFAQNADPAQLVNDGKAALEAKNYQEAYTKFSTYMGHRTKRILRIERKEYQTY